MPRTLLALSAFFVLTLPSLAQSGTLEVPEHGFKIRRPPGWREVPVQASERWILARFQSNKDEIGIDTETRGRYEHRPVVRVIGFPKNTALVEKKEEDLGDIKLTSTSFPYRDYADYLKRNHPGGGYYISLEEKTKIGDVDATRVEYKFEKLSVPRRHMVMIYHLPARDLAVEVVVLESNYAKLYKTYLKYLSGLSPMAQEVAEGATGGTTETNGKPALKKDLTDAERKALRKERDLKRRAKLIEKARAALPAGWKVKETKELYVFTNASSKYTTRLVQLTTQLRNWLDDEFGYIGEGEVQKTLLRVCKDADEARLYGSASGDSYDFTTGEVVCAEGGGFLNSDISSLAWSICQQYFHDKNDELWNALPWWLDGGIRRYVGSASTGKRGLTFQVSADDLLRMKLLIQKREMIQLRDLVSKPAEDVAKGDEASYNVSTASELFVRFLIEGPGKKGKLTKSLIQNYMKAVEGTLDEMEKEWFTARIEGGTYKEPETEEEEAAEIKARQERGKQLGEQMKQNQQKRLTEWYDRTFSEWTDKDWANVQKTFEGWIAR